MSGHQQSTASSNVPTSSVVQIAFDSDVEPDHCGYCNTNGSCTVGLYLFDSTDYKPKMRNKNFRNSIPDKLVILQFYLRFEN
jgi:hypothetical protein